MKKIDLEILMDSNMFRPLYMKKCFRNVVRVYVYLDSIRKFEQILFVFCIEEFTYNNSVCAEHVHCNSENKEFSDWTQETELTFSGKQLSACIEFEIFIEKIVCNETAYVISSGRQDRNKMEA
jgi:hypothetical protein